MKTNEPIGYTETEIRSFLPTGWNLMGTPGGTWDAKQKVWRTTLLDNVDFDWPLEVKTGDVSSHGRMEALRRAMDRVYRERLG